MNKFLTAVAMGVVIGMLFAPQKGADTRESLSDNLENLRHFFNKLIGKANDRIAELRESLEHELKGMDENIKGKVLTLFDEAALAAQKRKA